MDNNSQQGKYSHTKNQLPYIMSAITNIFILFFTVLT